MFAEVCGGGRPLERLLELPKTSVDGFVLLAAERGFHWRMEITCF